MHALYSVRHNPTYSTLQEAPLWFNYHQHPQRWISNNRFDDPIKQNTPRQKNVSLALTKDFCRKIGEHPNRLILNKYKNDEIKEKKIRL